VLMPGYVVKIILVIMQCVVHVRAEQGLVLRPKQSNLMPVPRTGNHFREERSRLMAIMILLGKALFI
jgi:hypothetical protein